MKKKLLKIKTSASHAKRTHAHPVRLNRWLYRTVICFPEHTAFLEKVSDILKISLTEQQKYRLLTMLYKWEKENLYKEIFEQIELLGRRVNYFHTRKFLRPMLLIDKSKNIYQCD